jgi:hypothetical protein
VGAQAQARFATLTKTLAIFANLQTKITMTEIRQLGKPPHFDAKGGVFCGYFRAGVTLGVFGVVGTGIAIYEGVERMQ